VHPGIHKRASVAELTLSFRRAVNRLIGSPKHAVAASWITLIMEMLRQWVCEFDEAGEEVPEASKLSNGFHMSISNDRIR
jgi:hypothetical protein